MSDALRERLRRTARKWQSIGGISDGVYRDCASEILDIADRFPSPMPTEAIHPLACIFGRDCGECGRWWPGFNNWWHRLMLGHWPI